MYVQKLLHKSSVFSTGKGLLAPPEFIMCSGTGKERSHKVYFVDDNSALEIILEADNKVWWTIIDADDDALVVLIACKASAKVPS